MINRRPKISAHSGLKRPSGTIPVAICVKLLGVFFISVEFLKQRAWRSEPSSEAKRFVMDLLGADGLAPR